ncbi:hypothetical protein KKG65_04010 [Patescibacteria group bacterium]|nr:hypothetical protein [Patescibacteria group bacterium]
MGKVRNNKTIYFANAWKGLITKTARQQLENLGWTVDGNWLNGKNINSLYKVIFIAPAYFDKAIIINPKEFPTSKVFTYLLYPDELVGWNFKTSSYLKEKQKAFIPLLKTTTILSHSQYTLDLVASTYGESLNQTGHITYLPIEFNNIQKVRTGMSTRRGTTIKVLWNHMWRSDKGIGKALTIVDQLSLRYPDVEFYVGRKESWGKNPDVNTVKRQTKEVLLKLQTRNNVFFRPGFNSSKIIDYWKFLTQFDIGFSVSPQEGFGLSMLEQAAAGVACVMPSKEAYPEIHSGGLLVQNVAEGVSDLIKNSLKRKEVSQKGIKNASKFNAENWTERILEKIIQFNSFL